MHFFISIVVSVLALLIFSYFAYRLIGGLAKRMSKVWQDVRSTMVGYVTKVQQEREIARSLDALPVYIQRGMHRLSVARQCSEALPEQWRLLLRPVIAKADEIGHIVLDNPVYAEVIRRFFTVTLDAFESFVDALLENHAVMGRIEEEKAMQSIEVFRKDFLAYGAVLSKKRLFDFHVLTDVIKHRLRK